MILFRPQAQCWECSRFVAGRRASEYCSISAPLRASHQVLYVRSDLLLVVLVFISGVLMNTPAINSGS